MGGGGDEGAFCVAFDDERRRLLGLPAMTQRPDLLREMVVLKAVHWEPARRSRH